MTLLIRKIAARVRKVTPPSILLMDSFSKSTCFISSILAARESGKYRFPSVPKHNEEGRMGIG
jgi:hypothetical protein